MSKRKERTSVSLIAIVPFYRTVSIAATAAGLTAKDVAIRSVIEWAEHVVQGLQTCQDAMQRVLMLLRAVHEAETQTKGNASPLSSSPANAVAGIGSVANVFGDLGSPPPSGPSFSKTDSLEMAIREIGMLQKSSSLDGLLGALGQGQTGHFGTQAHPDEEKV